MTQKLWHKIAAGIFVVATFAFSSTGLAAPLDHKGAMAVATQSASVHPHAPISDAERYAQRERATPQLQNFRGGDTIVIGASAVAVVLLVVLIIVLI